MLGELGGGARRRSNGKCRLGQIVGAPHNGAANKAVLWDNDQVTGFGILYLFSRTLSINEHGQIVGYSGTGSFTDAVL